MNSLPTVRTLLYIAFIEQTRATSKFFINIHFQTSTTFFKFKEGGICMVYALSPSMISSVNVPPIVDFI